MKADRHHLWSVLESFDGRDIAPLRECVGRCQFTEESLEVLWSLVENEGENFQMGASWILLNGPGLHPFIGSDDKRRMIEILSGNGNWQITLHLLQLFPRLEVSAAECEEFLPVFQRLSEHARPFVRAWAYNALYRVGDRLVDQRPAIAEKLTAALRNEKNSVQARIRNAARKSAWMEE